MADRKQSGNWNLWQDIPQAEIWKWVALSLNIEPENLPGLDFKPIGGGPFDDCPAEFQGRLTKAVAHIEAGTLAVKRPGYSSWQDIVEKNIFVTWASNELKFKLPPKLVAMTPQSEPDKSTGKATKRENQIRAIEATADKLNFQRLAIREGQKKDIEAECKKQHKGLFGGGPDPFKRAWQAAVKQNRMRMELHEKYSKR